MNLRLRSCPTIGLGPDKSAFQSLLRQAGLNKNLNPMQKGKNGTAPDPVGTSGTQNEF